MKHNAGFIPRTFLLTSLLALAQTAQATIIIDSATRDVVVGDPTTAIHGASSPSTAAGPYSDSAANQFSDSGHSPKNAEANQTSMIDAATGVFSGFGDAGLDYSLYQDSGVYAQSVYDVAFTLTSDYAYNLAGALTTDVDGGRAESLFQLFDASANLLLSFDAIANGIQYITFVDLASAGTLGAGSYRLLVESVFDNCSYSRILTDGSDCRVGGGAMGSPHYNNTYDFNMRLTALTNPPSNKVPEPGTVALLGLGFGLLRASRRRQVA